MIVKESITNYMSEDLKKIFFNIHDEFFQEISEIRLRVDKPLIIVHRWEEFFINKSGLLVKKPDDCYIVKKNDISKIIELMSNYSLYAIEDEIRWGYLSLPGGHRVGITGKVVLENNFVKTIKNINALNIRVSHEIKGCGNKAIKYIYGKSIMHTMVISPPGCGKTTILRDIIRILSDGVDGKFVGQTVSVIDERSEIGGCYQGVPQNDLGIRTDILDGCPKAIGMTMVLRSMSPKIIAVDEIGKLEDIHAIEDIINAGIKLICTVHGSSLEDIKTKPVLSKILEKNIFERFIVLKELGKIAAVYNEKLEDITYSNR